MCRLKAAARVPNEEFGDVLASEFLIDQVEIVETILLYLIPRLYHTMLSISRVSAETEVALVESTEIVAGVSKILREVGTASTVFTIAMHEIDDSLSLFGLSRVSIVLEVYIFSCCFLYTDEVHWVNFRKGGDLEINVPWVGFEVI